MLFIDVLAIDNNEVLSLVGAGGKTSLLLEIAEELRSTRRILVTTTTKIYVPSEEKMDGLFMSSKEMAPRKAGIYVYSGGLTEEGKLLPISSEERNQLIPTFDNSIIEADGAKRKLLKGWNASEPVIDENTTMTIGVFNIKALGIMVCEDNIHRVKEFMKITGAKEGDLVNKDHIKKLILHEDGIFKGAKGRKVLFINGIEEEASRNESILLSNMLFEEKHFICRVVGGSIINKEFIRLI